MGSDFFLLAGDEDLREGVKEAQDQGVRVTLIGVSPVPGTRNQSPELVYGEQALGSSLRGNQEARHQLRGSFWTIVSEYMDNG